MFSKQKLYYILLTLIIIVGSYLRFKGLGKWPLALDEFYILRSIQNILDKGIPQFDAGGYYTRGLIYQYVVACLVKVGAKAEFISRFVSVVLNLIAFPALFILTKKVLNKTSAILIVSLFAFSLWEIELSRFARMYTFFQTIFIWYLLYLYKYFFEENNKAVYWLLGLSFFSLFVYEASIFIVGLNFLTFLWDNKKKKFTFDLKKGNYVYLVISFLILFFALFFLMYDFRGVNINEVIPIELKEYFANTVKSGKFRIPIILVSQIQNSISIFFLAIILIPSLFVIYKIFKYVDDNFLLKFSLISIVLLSIANLYSLIILFTILFFLLGWINISDIKRIPKLFFVLLGFNLFIQLLYANIDLSWQAETSYRIGTDHLSNTKILFKEFLNFPNLYELFALFRDTYKIHTFFSVAILLPGTVLLIRRRNILMQKNFFFILLLLLLFIVTIINTQWFETRYFFFLYPLFLICLLISINEIAEIIIKNSQSFRTVFILFIGAIFFIVSEDINAHHLLNIDSAEINFRKNMNDDLKSHFYPRWNTREISDIINNKSDKDDIIISNEKICSFYLDRLDNIYVDYMSNDFLIQSVNHGKNERWTNASLIYNLDDFYELLFNNKKNIWLIVNKMWGVKLMTKDGLFEKLDEFIYYKDDDGLTFLYRIPSDTKIKKNEK